MAVEFGGEEPSFILGVLSNLETNHPEATGTTAFRLDRTVAEIDSVDHVTTAEVDGDKVTIACWDLRHERSVPCPSPPIKTVDNSRGSPVDSSPPFNTQAGSPGERVLVPL